MKSLFPLVFSGVIIIASEVTILQFSPFPLQWTTPSSCLLTLILFRRSGDRAQTKQNHSSQIFIKVGYLKKTTIDNV